MGKDGGVDPEMLHAWLAGRSIARGLPAPVADRGGFRVDTASEAELRRWVFAQTGDGLTALGRSITGPRQILKLCDTAEALRAILPDRWQVEATGHFMHGGGAHGLRPLPASYTLETDQSGAVTAIRIHDGSGALAASGYAAETRHAFVYDRIATAPGHRRRGLGAALMAALQRAKRTATTPELLVATEAGHALYETLGWRTLSPYATAAIPEGAADCG